LIKCWSKVPKVVIRVQNTHCHLSKNTGCYIGALKIDFKPRTAIKSQALVDFMAEWGENQLPTPTE
jgi:hypothetical protein